MPARPDDQYDPVASVVPTTDAPNDQIRTQASGADFGAQVGATAEQAGQTGQRVADQVAEVALKRQGMINESLATNADTQYSAALGAALGNYKTKEGLDAWHSLPDATAQISAIRQQVAASLPNPMAQQAFNTLAARREAYALGDANTYAAEQVKQADLTSARASVTNATQEAGSLPVAQDDKRFQDSLHDIDFGITRMMQNRGYGSSMTQDPATGKITFDASTPAGQSAKAVYDAQIAAAHGDAWQNRIQTLADNDKLAQAQQVFEANRDAIPAEAQMKIAAYLQPKVRTMQASLAAGTALQGAESDYQTYIGKSATTAPVDAITNAISTQESSNNANALTSVTGAVGKFQIEPGTFKQYAQPGESITSAADNETVGKRIIADLSQKYGNDAARVAVAYFSGPANVAPAGSPTPWISNKADPTGKTTSSYVSDVLGRLGGAAGLQTKADFYKANEDNILEQTRQAAEAQHPGDPQFADLAVARTQQQMRAEISRQEQSFQADRDTVWKSINAGVQSGSPPVTVDQLRATSPDVATAWDRLASNQPQVAHEFITNVLPGLAKGTSAKDFGPEFNSVYNRILLPDGDPNKITDDRSFAGLLDKGLTMQGIEKAQKILADQSKPESASETILQKQLFKVAHQQLSWEDENGFMKDPQGEALYSHFLPLAFAAIDKGKAAGKPIGSIYDIDSPEMKGIIGTLKRNAAQHTADMMAQNSLGAPPAPAAPGLFTRIFGGGPDLSTPEAVRQAYTSGKIDRVTAFSTIKQLQASATPPAAPTE